MLPQSASRWCTVPVETLTWREWDGEVVVRNDVSGATHLLPSFSGRIFFALVESHDGATVHDVLLKLNDRQAPTDETERLGAIEAALWEFERIGLVGQQRLERLGTAPG